MDEHNLDQILTQFATKYNVNDSSALSKIFQLGKVQSVNRKHNFIKYGQIDKRIAFVLSGIFRGYILGEEEEKTLWFSNEAEILASYDGILHNKPSKTTYQALEDSSLLVIHYDELKKLSNNNHDVAKILIHLLEQLLLESYDRNERSTLLDAEQRYLDLLDRKPTIFNRVSQKLLASYIGITPVSLSRLRARLQQKKP